jgi:quercetin dioxygenase-like cupin family protein
MRSHPGASVLYYLTDASVKYTYPDGRTGYRTVKAGTAFWIDAVKHGVENVGADEFHGVHIELKEPPKSAGSWESLPRLLNRRRRATLYVHEETS